MSRVGSARASGERNSVDALAAHRLQHVQHVPHVGIKPVGRRPCRSPSREARRSRRTSSPLPMTYRYFSKSAAQLSEFPGPASLGPYGRPAADGMAPTFERDRISLPM